MNVRASSPCIGVCTLDIESGYCEGCYRTREEVACWWHYSAEEQERIQKALSERRSQLGSNNAG